MGLADEILAFRIEKKVTIQNWRVGAVHKVSQLLVVVIVILQLYMENTWAYSEVPKGSVNAFAESGNSADHRELTDTSELSHCGSSPGVNSENSYAYDAFFVMDNPLCLNLHPYEIARKGIGELSFTTAFIEMTQIGWPNNAADNASKTLDCIASGGRLSLIGMQHVCETQRTVYPLGVELMSVVFEHSFEQLDSTSRFQDLAGSVNVPAPDETGGAGVDRCTVDGVCPIDSIIVAANGTAMRTVTSGRAVSMSVEELLDLSGVSLQAENTNLTPDYRDVADGTDPPRYPRFRSAGVRVDVSIEYDNRNQENGKPEWDSKEVVAKVTPRASTKKWAGDGPIMHYELYPTGPVGEETYAKVIRYRQGVQLVFHTSGKLWKMDWLYVLQSFINGLVLLSLAKALANFYAENLDKAASMIKNTTRDYFNFDRRNAEIGMKAALTALLFDSVDVNKKGQISTAEVVACLARLQDVTFEQAVAVANLVVCKNEKAVGEGISFDQFLASREGRMIGFSEYLKIAERVGGPAKFPHTDLGECRKLFDAARASRRSSRLIETSSIAPVLEA